MQTRELPNSITANLKIFRFSIASFYSWLLAGLNLRLGYLRPICPHIPRIKARHVQCNLASHTSSNLASHASRRGRIPRRGRILPPRPRHPPSFAACGCGRVPPLHSKDPWHNVHATDHRMRVKRSSLFTSTTTSAPLPPATSMPPHNATPATSAPPQLTPAIPVPALTHPSAFPPRAREHARARALDCIFARARACTVRSVCRQNFSDNYLPLIGTCSD